MSLFDLFRERYQIHLSKDDLDEKEIKALALRNTFPSDFIIMDVDGLEKAVNIYHSSVTISDIAKFFKSKIPFLKLELNSEILQLEKEEEILSAKMILFASLAGLLENMSSLFNDTGILPEEFSQLSSGKEYQKDGRTYH